jgi:LPXTG-motif cell wall-anchored protein
VIIEVDVAGAYNGHLGASHQDGRDIIPPFDYDVNGNGTIEPNETFSQNWDAEHIAIYDNGCEVPLGTTIVNTTTTMATTTTSTTLPCEATTTTTGQCETTTTGTVLGTTLVRNGGLGKPHTTPVLPKRVPPDHVLPFTGSDPSPFIGMAGVLMALGGSLVLASRRRRAYGL